MAVHNPILIGRDECRTSFDARFLTKSDRQLKER